MKRDARDRRAFCEVPARIRPALRVLLEAHQYAVQTSGNCWEFAVEINELTALGVTANDLRWLVRQGLVEHQREVTVDGDDGRAFRPTGDLTFPSGTCFVLTEQAIATACCVRGADECGEASSDSAATASGSENDRTRSNPGPTTARTRSAGTGAGPMWDPERRELHVAGLIVKRFKWPAVNQEAILTAFAEEGWPPRIDDPLPPHPEQDSKRRLSDTIKCLNRHQQNQLLHFRGDGTGEGVIWERIAREHSDSSRADL